MALPQVEVFIFTKQNAEDIRSVINLFTGTSTKGLKASSINVMAPNERNKWDSDYCMVLDAFAKASPDAYVIIAKDTCVSALTSSSIYDVLGESIASCKTDGNQFDIFYLARWLDRCDQYSNIREVSDRGLKIVDTVSPNGVLALMFTPEGRQKFLAAFNPETSPITDRPLGQVLNNRISARTAPGVTDVTRPANMQRFLAATAYPSLITFDITKRTSDAEFLKTVDCRGPPEVVPVKARQSSDMGLFWFIIVVVVVVLLGWALIALGNRFTGGSAPVIGTMPAPVAIVASGENGMTLPTMINGNAATVTSVTQIN